VLVACLAVSGKLGVTICLWWLHKARFTMRRRL
jgi:hypothetical protein